jgi:ribosomal protein S27AE
MATQRYISSFWTDKWIRSLDPSERYLYMYLLTNPETNIAGVYDITLDRIAFDTGYDERTLRPMFERFAKAGKVYFYDEEWIILPTWPKHQQYEKRAKIRDGIVSVLQDIPEEVISYLAEVGYHFDLSLVSTSIIATKHRSGISGTTRTKVIHASGGVCAECGAESESLEIHHITPLKDGGTNAVDNLEALCHDCHLKKHSPDRVYRLERQSIPVQNYSETDLDSDTDTDTDSDTGAGGQVGQSSDFERWLKRYAQDTGSIKFPDRFVQAILKAGTAHESWSELQELYRTQSARNTTVKARSSPRICPECGGILATTESRAKCTGDCKSHYDIVAGQLVPVQEPKTVPVSPDPDVGFGDFDYGDFSP